MHWESVLEQGRLQLDSMQVGLLKGVGRQSAIDGAACSCHAGAHVGRPVSRETAEQDMWHQGAQ